MHPIESGMITAAVEGFLRSDNGRSPEEYRRERSWDFCFNYFQDNAKPTQNMELSCLQLGYYLASWGMLRGSSYLFRETNARHYRAAVEIIERYNPEMREIDQQPFGDADAQISILAAAADLKCALLPKGGASRTLVSKVMMGTWGTIPSFDTYFVKGFRSLAETRDKAAFNTITSRSLTLLGEFYQRNRSEIDGLTEHHSTLDFNTGEFTDRRLSRAKIIDMFGFYTGFNG
jgi:hypothetical protein